MDVALIFLIPSQILVTIIFFFLPYFGNALPQLPQNFFFLLLFRQWYCHNWFFFSTSHFEHTAYTLEQADRAVRILVITLPKFMHSLSPIFSLSHTFVEFRQRYCQNSLSLLILLNKLEQYL